MEPREPASILRQGVPEAIACPACGCEASRRDLVCPRCARLLHSVRLKELARAATQAEAEERWGEAARTWREALALIPNTAKQHARVAANLESAAAKAPRESLLKQAVGSDSRSPALKWIGGLGALGLLLWKFKFILVFVATKAKFLLLGLSKGGTLLSMLASFGLYWSIWGWWFAAGLVGSIYVHEMGHVAALSRLGIRASAPMFIPGVGAFVRMHEYPASPKEEAEVGLAGPIWGLGAALVCWGVYLLTGSGAWGAIAQVGASLNLFNLIPFWQLDGARGFQALTSGQRGLAVGAVASVMLPSGQGLLVLIAAVGAWKALRGGARTPNWRVWAIFVALIGSLSWLATLNVPVPVGLS